jgi:hypothetical protein
MRAGNAPADNLLPRVHPVVQVVQRPVVGDVHRHLVDPVSAVRAQRHAVLAACIPLACSKGI